MTLQIRHFLFTFNFPLPAIRRE